MDAGGQKTISAVLAIASSMESLLGIRRQNAGGLSVSKYRNRKTTVDGVTYDSAREARRGAELMLMERAGIIHDLCAQVVYTLIPAQRVGGKVVEHPVRYIADFVYKDENGQQVVEDVKGVRTKEYVIKRKLMLWKYGIRVREV